MFTTKEVLLQLGTQVLGEGSVVANVGRSSFTVSCRSVIYHLTALRLIFLPHQIRQELRQFLDL